MNYVGVDLHKNRFTAYSTATGNYRNYGTNGIGLMSFIEDCKRSIRSIEQVIVGVESTGNTLYFTRVLGQ